LFLRYGRGDLARHFQQLHSAFPDTEATATPGPSTTSGASSPNGRHPGASGAENGTAFRGASAAATLPPPAEPEVEPGKPEQLANDLERMGPPCIKLGQVLAGRPDLLPPAYQTALERLQDRVAPFPSEEVEKILFQELGARVSKAFASFD